MIHWLWCVYCAGVWIHGNSLKKEIRVFRKQIVMNCDNDMHKLISRTSRYLCHNFFNGTWSGLSAHQTKKQTIKTKSFGNKAPTSHIIWD